MCVKLLQLSPHSHHVSRKHKDCSEQSLDTSTGNSSSTEDCNDECDIQLENPNELSYEDMEASPEKADEKQFLKHLELFYLKLQAKLLLPASSIQTIIEHYQEIHDINQSHLLCKPESHIKAVIDTLKSEDLRRKTFFKSNFNYVEPVSLCLGQNESGKECFAQYIPVTNTIESLLSSESVKEQLQQIKPRAQSENIIQDLWDGTNIKENLLLKHTASSLGIILYQDSFEVVNPLGSGKKKHKILTVYLILANILLHNKSNIHQMQLVLLCREQDYKYFGQDLVFGSYVKDLKDLELNGVSLPDSQLCMGTLCAIAGDNLGSHNTGGFAENFSKSSHFCRYCEIDRKAFLADPLAKGPDRTLQSYQKHVEAQSHNVEARDCGGVKFDSIFNELTYFHVCQPGLPPCLGHDLFEGVVYRFGIVPQPPCFERKTVF